MISSTNRSLVCITALLLGGTLLSAAGQEMPGDAAIKREFDKQSKRSAAAISQADRQSKLMRAPVPDVGKAPPVAAPDPASIAKRYETMGSIEDSSLFIMVSFSMPIESIDRLAEQSSKVGATMVLRGVLEGSLTKTAETVARIVKRHPKLQLQIDPTLYRRFGINQVPTFILTRGAFDSRTCGKECGTNDAFASVAGDVTLDYALDQLARQRRDPLSQLAERKLRKLRGSL